MHTYAYKREQGWIIGTKWKNGTKWMVPNKCCGIFFVHWYDQCTPAEKMLLFSSIIITIILRYAIIRIYIVLHIYLQVSETERLADLHWVTGHSILEKINLIYVYGISLAFSRMFFQESDSWKNILENARDFHGIALVFSEYSFKNPNVLLRMEMFLI